MFLKVVGTSILLLAICNFVPWQKHTSTQITSKTEDYDKIHMGIDLRLGMTRDSVISSLSETYRMQKLNLEGSSEGQSSWFVEDKSNPSEVEGALSFERNRLSTVTRYWSSTHDSNFGFANALYRAASNFKDEHRTACFLDSGAKENPRGTSKSIFLICGAKTLEIAIYDYELDAKPVRSADIMEILGNR